LANFMRDYVIVIFVEKQLKFLFISDKSVLLISIIEKSYQKGQTLFLSYISYL